MTDPKPTTNDILSKIRKGATPAKVEQPEGSPPIPTDSSASDGSLESPGEKPAAPSGTADILAAARAKAAPTKTSDIVAAAKSKPATGTAAAKSPADIMAAIRGGGGGPAAAPAKKPVESPAKPVAAKPVATGLSPAEMIRKAREGAGTGVSSAVKKPALPSKPLPGKAVAATDSTRRSFISDMVGVLCSPIVIAWTAFTTAATASALAVARFMMPNVLVEPPTKFKIGPPNDYAPGTVSTKWQAQFGVWIVNSEVDGSQEIYALSTVCTHLGCTTNWLEGEQKFKCPCHGSGFYKSGVNFEGPAPRPLERFGLRLAEDGMLEVDKGLKFQKELGQWANPACFVPVA